jgi:hypothetical protein
MVDQEIARWEDDGGYTGDDPQVIFDSGPSHPRWRAFLAWCDHLAREIGH